jgi:hypothetical protein
MEGQPFRQQEHFGWDGMETVPAVAVPVETGSELRFDPFFPYKIARRSLPQEGAAAAPPVQ